MTISASPRANGSTGRRPARGGAVEHLTTAERAARGIRQLWDGKGSALVELMEPNALAAYAEICGWTLARAHARSGDAAAIAAYLGSGESFDGAMASFAEAYADQNELDYAAFRGAIDSGRLAAEEGL